MTFPYGSGFDAKWNGASQCIGRYEGVPGNAGVGRSGAVRDTILFCRNDMLRSLKSNNV